MIIRTVFGDEVDFNGFGISVVSLSLKNILGVDNDEPFWALLVRPTENDEYSILAFYPVSDLKVATDDLAELIEAYEDGAPRFKMIDHYLD